MSLMGLKWRRGGAARAGRAPPLPLVRIGQGGRGGAPLSFLSSLPSFPLSYLDKEREGSPTPGRSRTPPARLLLGPAAPPLGSFIYGGKGAP